MTAVVGNVATKVTSLVKGKLTYPRITNTVGHHHPDRVVHSQLHVTRCHRCRCSPDPVPLTSLPLTSRAQVACRSS